MREWKRPPSRRSTLLRVVCHSSVGVFQRRISSGSLQALQTASSGALTAVSTVTFMVSSFGKDGQRGYAPRLSKAAGLVRLIRVGRAQTPDWRQDHEKDRRLHVDDA